MRRTITSFLAVAVAALGGATALSTTGAGATSTCVFDKGTMRVSVTGTVVIGAVANGAIQVDGARCVFGVRQWATTANTLAIVVTGSPRADLLVLDHKAPLQRAGVDIPITVDLGIGADIVRFNGTNGPDAISVGADGANYRINGNADTVAEVVATNVEQITVFGGVGADVISGAGDAVVGAAFPARLILDGGPDGDVLTGGVGNDQLQGGAGADQLNGNDGNDVLFGGPDNDIEHGNKGNDRFAEGNAPNGSDDLIGDLGTDVTDYSARTAAYPVTVVQNGLGFNDDGTPGEGDDVFTENVVGGLGNDSLTGNPAANVLTGGPGIDVLNGLGGADVLRANDGQPGDTVDGGVDAVVDTCTVDAGDVVSNCP